MGVSDKSEISKPFGLGVLDFDLPVMRFPFVRRRTGAASSVDFLDPLTQLLLVLPAQILKTANGALVDGTAAEFVEEAVEVEPVVLDSVEEAARLAG